MRWLLGTHRRAPRLLVTSASAFAGCGGSKPAYCTDRSNLENSVKGLADLTVTSGMSGLEAQLNKIKTNSSTSGQVGAERLSQ